MSKASRSRSKERRAKVKKARKEAQKARYKEYAAKGNNSKRKVSQNKKARHFRADRHLHGACGNVGCTRCFVRTGVPLGNKGYIFSQVGFKKKG